MRGLPNDFRKSRQRGKQTDLSFPGAAKRGIGLAKTRAEQRPTCIPCRRGKEESRLRSERLGPESVPPPERAASRVSFTSRKLRLSAPPKRKIPQRADGAKKRRAAADPAAGGKLSSAAAQAMPSTGQRNVTNQKDRSVAARRAGDRVGNLVRLLDAVLPVKGIRHIQRTVRQLSGFRHSADRFRSGRLGDSRTGDRLRPAAGNHDAAGLRIDAAGRIFRLLRMPVVLPADSRFRGFSRLARDGRSIPAGPVLYGRDASDRRRDERAAALFRARSGYCARRREYAEKRVVGISRRDRADHRAGDRFRCCRSISSAFS